MTAVSPRAPVQIWAHDAMAQHRPSHATRTPHPESPARIQEVLAGLRRLSTTFSEDQAPRWHTPVPASIEALERVHTPRHVAAMLALEGRTVQLDPDTSVSPQSLHAAMLAAGACEAAGEHCAHHPGAVTVCLTRPPGHHATADQAMGFCLFSNLAVGIAAARRCAVARPIQRVLVLDWDVHLGNGTVDIFWDDPDVVVVDLHQEGIYPFTGDMHARGGPAAAGATVQLPLAAGAGDDDYLACLDAMVGPLLDRHAPDLLCVAGGFDAHRDDPLGGQRISTRGYAAMTRAVMGWARAAPHRRVMMTMEGGYDLPALTASMAACLEALVDGQHGDRKARAAPRRLASSHDGDPTPLDAAMPSTRSMLRAALGLHGLA